jgi:hypothetical protein
MKFAFSSLFGAGQALTGWASGHAALMLSKRSKPCKSWRLSAPRMILEGIFATRFQVK